MGLANSIRRNSFFSFLSSAIRLLTNVLLFVGVARYYGPEAFGQFTTALTYATIFLLFADFGLDVLLTTEIARQRDKAVELFGRYLSIKFIFVFVAVAGMWIIPFVQPMSNSTKWLTFIFSFYVACTALTNFCFALFKGFEQLHFETKISFVNNIILLAGLFILGYIGVPIYVVALAFVATRAIGLFNSYRVVAQLLTHQRLLLNFKSWKEIRGQVFVFGFHLLFGNLFFLLDTVLISLWKGDHDVGIYQSALRLINVVFVIPEVMTSALMPVLSRFHEENKDRWDSIGKLMNKTLIFFGLPISLIFFVYAEQIIHIVYGTKAFSEAVPILRIFGLIILIRFSVETYALMLTTSRRQKTRLTVVFLATIFNFLLNLYAIPHYGISGAVWVSLTTNLFVGIGYVTATRKIFFKWIFDFRGIIPLMVTMILGFVLWNIRMFPIWYVCPFVLLGYMLIYYFMGFPKEERRLIFTKEFL